MTKRKNNKKKDVVKKIDNIESNVEKEWFKILKIVFVVLVFLSGFYLLTVLIVSDGDNKNDEKVETVIQYEEILAGSSLTMSDSEYLVVYYDFSDAELSDLVSSISTYNSIGELRIYTVDMSNGFNSKYVGTDESNTNPHSADELLIKGSTLIKVNSNKVEEYVEGVDEIINYLK